MNREIKFRVWDGEQIVSPDYINRAGYGCWKSNSIPETSNLLMQFTGLKDKNGKEIYEGDICKTLIEVGGISERIKGFGYGVVEYSSNRFTINHFKYDDSLKTRFGKNTIYGFTRDNFSRIGETEIIGNIYENPELLKC
jgi:uncharacterized phage protein (TIGR01671 family)